MHKPLPLGHNISNDFSKFPAAHEKPEKVALIWKVGMKRATALSCYPAWQSSAQQRSLVKMHKTTWHSYPTKNILALKISEGNNFWRINQIWLNLSNANSNVPLIEKAWRYHLLQPICGNCLLRYLEMGVVTTLWLGFQPNGNFIWGGTRFPWKALSSLLVFVLKATGYFYPTHIRNNISRGTTCSCKSDDTVIVLLYYTVWSFGTWLDAPFETNRFVFRCRIWSF